MRIPLPVALAAALTLAACGGPSEEAKLPAEAPKKSFVVQSESLLRGVNGSSNTIPRGRSAAILNVKYSMECLTGGSATANQRMARAKKKLDQTYVVSPYYFQNPRERGAWRRSASEMSLAYGCQVTGLETTSKTTSRIQVLKYIIENKVPPAR